MGDPESSAASAASAASLAERQPGDQDRDQAEFPTNALPPVLCRIAQQVSALRGAPVAVPALSGLTATAASIGHGLVIPSGYGLVSGANLYAWCAAESGVYKSVVFADIFRPLQALQAELLAHAGQRKHQAQTVTDFLAEKIKQLRQRAAKADDPNEVDDCLLEASELAATLEDARRKVRPRTLICSDTSSAALAEVLADNDEVVFSLSPDAGDAMAMLVQPGSDAIYTKAFTGEPLSIHRKGKPPIHLLNPRLTLFWFLQPDRLTELYDNRRLDYGGFLPRVMVYQAGDPGPIDREARPDPQITAHWDELIRSLVKRYRTLKKPITVAVEPEVTAFLFEREADLEQYRNCELADIWRYPARWVELAWRVALNLHAMTHGQDADQRQVVLATAQDAWAIIEYYANQQLQILRCLRRKRKKESESKIFGLLDQQPEITVRDVLEHRILHSAVHARARLDSMVAEGKLIKRVETPARGGHSTTFYQRRKI